MAGKSNDAFVEYQHVQKSYDGETLVVKDLNLAMPQGEFLTMLGPSGSGKTTCLMMLAGFETATHGEIMLDGKPINAIPPHKRGIGMVFQSYALFPHMTVAENLSFPLEVRGFDKSDREAKVQRALDMVQMGVFDDGRIQQLAPPDQLYEQPDNSFVAQFIGENNTLAGIVTSMSKDSCVVRLEDGSEIDASPVNVEKVGDKTMVSIRPERVEFDVSRLHEGAHTLKATVKEFIYMGDIFRTRLSVAGNDNFIVKTRNAPNQVRLTPGTEISIGWQTEDCRALDA